MMRMIIAGRRLLCDVIVTAACSMHGTGMEPGRFDQRPGKPEAPDGQQGTKPNVPSHDQKYTHGKKGLNSSPLRRLPPSQAVRADIQFD